MSKEKLYSYNIELILMDEEQSIEKVVFNQNFQADNTQELAEILKPIWDHWNSVVESKADEEYNKYELVFLHTWNVFRISDDLHSDDDDTIPEAFYVHEDLMDILDR